MFNIVIFGAPGSGKGTQSEELIARYGFKHVSTGDLLRAEIKAGTALGCEAKSYIDKGQLVPDDTIIGMIENLLNGLKQEKGIILDGFPRTIPQAEALDKLMKAHNTQIDVMLELEVPEQELVDRLLKRGEMSGRSDDNLETITQRLAVYHAQTAPLAAYYQQQGIHKAIQGTGTVAEITERIAAVIARE